jgi:PAS domain S-box-containing protein
MDGGIGAEAWSPEQLLAFGAAADILSAAILSAQRSEALSDERAFATQVLDGVFDGVAVLDDTGRVVFANNALQAMLGEDGSELIGRNLHELGLPAAKPSATEGATSEPGVINRFETTLAKGAVPRTLMVREATTPIGGRDERRIVLVSDVTQRKRLEEELLRAAANAEAAS